MKTLKEKIEIMQAALDGKEIDIDVGGGFRKLGFKSDECVFNWQEYDYRIKLEPLEFWVNVYQSGFIADIGDTKEDAKGNISPLRDTGYIKTIKVREVTDE